MGDFVKDAVHVWYMDDNTGMGMHEEEYIVKLREARNKARESSAQLQHSLIRGSYKKSLHWAVVLDAESNIEIVVGQVQTRHIGTFTLEITGFDWKLICT